MTACEQVSVVIIFHNSEKFFREAIESVIAQTYDRWELLLVDDGSTDGSRDIALEYCAKYPERLRYLHHDNRENRGMSASRNLGIRHARGAYIALLDADDIWLPRQLEQRVAALGSVPEAAMVYGPSLMWHSWTGRAEDFQHDCRRRLGVPPESLIHPPALLELNLRGRADSPATCGVLMRRGLAEAVGGFEGGFRDLYEDQAFFAKVFLAAPVFVTGASFDRYRQHPDSSCSLATRNGRYHDELPSPVHAAFLGWLDRYLRDRAGSIPGIKKLIRRKLWWYRHPRLHYPARRIANLAALVRGVVPQKAVALMFAVARLILPASLRRRLWERWQQRRKALPAA